MKEIANFAGNGSQHDMYAASAQLNARLGEGVQGAKRRDWSAEEPFDAAP